jgi:hypothetical protein
MTVGALYEYKPNISPIRLIACIRSIREDHANVTEGFLESAATGRARNIIRGNVNVVPIITAVNNNKRMKDRLTNSRLFCSTPYRNRLLY